MRSGDAQLIRNIWIEEMQARMGQPAKHGRMVQLYLNGSYHGLYHIHEHADDDYLASYYPGSSEDYHFTGAATTGSTHGPGDTWNTVWAQLKSSLSDYAEAKRWIDMPNLADYMLLSFYAGNDWDWRIRQNWSAAGPKLRGPGRLEVFPAGLRHLPAGRERRLHRSACARRDFRHTDQSAQRLRGALPRPRLQTLLQ